MKVMVMSSTFFIKSFDKKFLSGILASILILMMTLSEATLSQESKTDEQNILRQASKQWMQVGIKQYRLDLFTDAERSFRRARIFQKYLTAAEHRQLNEYLENVRIAISEGKKAIPSKQAADKSVDPNQPVKLKVKAEKLVEKAKESESSTEEGWLQSKEERELTEEAARAEAQLQAQALEYSALEEKLKAEKETRLKAQQKAKAQTQARAKLEEQLKAETERRAKIEAEAKEAVKALETAKTKATAKAESYATIKQIEEKLKVQTEEGSKEINYETSDKKEQLFKAVEPAVPEGQVEGEFSQDVIVSKDKSLRAKFLLFSTWLSENRGIYYIFYFCHFYMMIGLPALALLIIISELREKRKRPGKMVYTNQVPTNSSIFGAKLNGSNKNNVAVEDSGDGRLPSAKVGNLKLKGFEKSTKHWMEPWKERHISRILNAGKQSRIYGK